MALAVKLARVSVKVSVVALVRVSANESEMKKAAGWVVEWVAKMALEKAHGWEQTLFV